MDAAQLPDLDTLDREALKALIRFHQEELSSLLAARDGEFRRLEAELDSQRKILSEQSQELRSGSEQIEHLKLVIEKLRRMMFGAKSEKIVLQLEQLEFHLEELESSQAEMEAAVERVTPADEPKTRSRRKSLPEHLSCCAASGQKPFGLTIAGCRPTGGTSGLGSISRVSGLKAREKSPSRSIARDRSMRVIWVFSRQRFAPFSKVNDRAGCMCSTSIPRSARPRSMKQDSQSRLTQLEEEERTSRHASTGWTSAELCRRHWFSLPTCAAHSRTMLLPTLCCGSQRSPAGRHSGRSFQWKRLSTRFRCLDLHLPVRQGTVVGQCPVRP